MSASKIFVCMLAAGLTFGAASGTARADTGAVIDATQLTVKQRTDLLGAIGKARTQSPKAFQRVAQALAGVEKLDKQKRGRFATVTPHLQALGKTALLPMLEALAVKGPARGNLTDTAWITLRVGLIEAVGMHRDPIALPVLNAILDKDQEYWVVRAAAEAMARIGDDASAAKLLGLARTAGPKQNAVLSGIADCRRAVVAQGLGDFLAAPTDFETTKLAIQALGGVGNAWAWKTPAVAKTGEEAATRGTAAKSLVDAFVRFDDAALRLAAQKAILLVDDPSTPALIEAAKSGASAETHSALDKLAAKFAKSPLRKY